MQEYVVGFLFNNALDKVTLIRKNKPDWQKGLLNGPGGKIENNESPSRAMTREFREECGIELKEWDLFCTIYFKEAAVYFFKKRLPVGMRMEDLTRSVTSETLEYIYIHSLPSERTIPNLQWLIPMAISFSKGECAKAFEVTEIYEH